MKERDFFFVVYIIGEAEEEVFIGVFIRVGFEDFFVIRMLLWTDQDVNFSFVGYIGGEVIEDIMFRQEKIYLLLFCVIYCRV